MHMYTHICLFLCNHIWLLACHAYCLDMPCLIDVTALNLFGFFSSSAIEDCRFCNPTIQSTSYTGQNDGAVMSQPPNYCSSGEQLSLVEV